MVVIIGPLFLAGCGSLPVSSAAPAVSAPALHIRDVPIKSTGCGKPAPVPPERSVLQTVVSGGLARVYLLHIPRSYQSDSPMAVVLNFHGHNSTDRVQEKQSGLSPIADKDNFIAVYPQGLAAPDGATGWATTARKRNQVNDVVFVSDLLNQLQARLCVDPGRIYAMGFSNGGGMTNLLACVMPNRLAAFASVSGAYPPDPYAGGCQPDRPVSILEIHGTSDEIVPYIGRYRDGIPSVPTWLEEWAARDGCAQNPVTFYEQGHVTGLEWTHCKGNATVIHYRITGGAHVWPAGEIVTGGTAGGRPLTASQLIWQFFQERSLPEALPPQTHS